MAQALVFLLGVLVVAHYGALLHPSLKSTRREGSVTVLQRIAFFLRFSKIGFLTLLALLCLF